MVSGQEMVSMTETICKTEYNFGEIKRCFHWIANSYFCYVAKNRHEAIQFYIYLKNSIYIIDE